MAESKQQATRQETTPATRSVSTPDWFDRWFGEFPFPVPRWMDAGRVFPQGPGMLRVEEFQDGDELVVRAEMPGIDPEKDVEIQVTDHTLYLRAERRKESKVEEKGRYRSEFSYGSFVRSVPLPATATEKDVKASYRDGILEVRVPMEQKAPEPRKIAVERA